MAQGDQSAGTDLTGLLRSWSDGNEQAFEQLIPVVYSELHRLALHYLAGERPNASLQPTGLVNEVCLRLLGWDEVRWKNRGHFFGVSAQMMRRVLVDIARKRDTHRRGGGDHVRVPIDEIEIAAIEPDTNLVDLDEALERLAAADPRKARVVELRFFGGLSMEEAAQTLGVSLRTVHNDWASARAWLFRELTARSPA